MVELMDVRESGDFSLGSMGFTGKWEVLIMGFSMGFNHEQILVEWD